MGETTVHIKSAKAQRLFRELRAYKKLTMRIAFKGRYPKGPTIAQVAAWMEYGTARIPARPFIRTAQAQSREKVLAVVATEINSIIHGNRTAATAARRIAQAMAMALVEAIDLSPFWAVPNAPATVAKKGHAHPLIDTKRLRNKGIHWQVVRGNAVVQQGRPKAGDI